MVKKIIFFIFSLFLVIIGIKNDLIKQKIAKTTPKKQEIKPERVSSSKMEKEKIQKISYTNKDFLLFSGNFILMEDLNKLMLSSVNSVSFFEKKKTFTIRAKTAKIIIMKTIRFSFTLKNNVFICITDFLNLFFLYFR